MRPSLLLIGLPGEEDRRFANDPGEAEADVDVAPQQIAAASARVSKFLACLELEVFDVRHLHLQTLLHLQGFSSEATGTPMRRWKNESLTYSYLAVVHLQA